MIDKLIEEMQSECPPCQGTGIELDGAGQYIIGTETACTHCGGSGKDLSFEGQLLIALIKDNL